MPRCTLAVLGILAVLALSGCTKEEPQFTANDQVPAEQRTTAEPAEGGGAEVAAEADGVWVVEGSDLAYDQAPSTLPSGEVSITLQNMSGLPHDVVFEGVEGGQPIVDAAANDSDTATVTLAAGTYTFFCDVPGHRAAGMEGTVTVA